MFLLHLDALQLAEGQHCVHQKSSAQQAPKLCQLTGATCVQRWR